MARAAVDVGRNAGSLDDTSSHTSEERIYTPPPPPPPPPRGDGVEKPFSQFWYSRSFKNNFQEVVVYRVSLPDTMLHC